MDNNLLKYLAFVKAVEKGSFTKAAGHDPSAYPL